MARQAFKLRAELVERSFALTLDRGGMRRTWLRGRDNVHKRYLIHVAGYNLGLMLRVLVGAGTPKAWRDRASAGLFVLRLPNGGFGAVIWTANDGTVVDAIALILTIPPD